MEFNKEKYLESVFNNSSPKEFERIALEAFRYQFQNNAVYRRYCNLILKNDIANKVNSLANIPFLPVELFKNHIISSCNSDYELVFYSSGTTGNLLSKHYVYSTKIYKKSLINSFSYFFGKAEEYVILAIVPDFNDQKHSSLSFMLKELIRISNNKLSGFYAGKLSALSDAIASLERRKVKYLIYGVSYALLDYAKLFTGSISYGRVIETGGMKGRRKEMTREELHNEIAKSFGIDKVYSEYGMTELFSQAYSLGDGIFKCPEHMKVLCRDSNDPLTVSFYGKGALNIIDLANIDSCCFVAVSDLGSVFQDGTFTVEGRFDDSDVRGCNLMIF